MIKLILRNIFFLSIFIFLVCVPANANKTNFNSSKIPMFEFDGTPLIETINGSYYAPNGYILGGKIHDIKNEDIELDYYLITYDYNLSTETTCINLTDPRIFRYSPNASIIDILYNYTYVEINGTTFLVDNKTGCRIKGNALTPIETNDTRLENNSELYHFNVIYKIKNKNIPVIIPFIINFGRWATFVNNEKITEIHNSKFLGNSSLELYGKDKALLVSSIPSPFIWNLSVDNGTVTLSTVGFQPKNIGVLDIEMRIHTIRSNIETIKIIRSDITQDYKIIPRIIMDSTGTELSQISFKYKQNGNIIDKSVHADNEKMFVFDNEPIDIEGNEFYFPFDSYESLIFEVNPPALQTKNITLNLNIESPFDGTAYFENNNISFHMKTNVKILQKFWISFFAFIISLIIFFLKLKKEELAKYAMIESILGIFLIYYGALEHLLSLGTIMFIAAAILLIFFFYKKN